jgi:two-component sensor histidine kinase
MDPIEAEAQPGVVMPGVVMPGVLAGGGEMGARMRAFDWSASPLGLPESWAQPLKTLVGVLLASKQAMFIGWGPRRIMLYNDSYAEILGLKHPGALGQPFDQVWSEIWEEVEPIMARCYAGEPIQMDEITLIMHRHGRPEETHFAFSYTPVRDEAGQVAGVFCPCLETTAKVLADRRQAFRLGLENELRDLSDPRDVMARAAEALGRHLDAAQVGYAEVCADGHATTGGEFHDGRMPSFRAGRYRLEDYGPAMAADMAAGRTVVVHDVWEDARTSSPDAIAAYAAISLRAFIIVPLVKAGRLTAYLYAAHPEPRRWSEEDLVLVREVAEQTWAAVERARAEATLRESEARWRAIFENMHEGFALCEMVYGPDGRAVDFRYIELNAAWERLTGLPVPESIGHTGKELFQNLEEFWILTYEDVARTGKPAHFQHQIASIGRWYEVFAYRTEPGRFAALFLDITQRRADEERRALLSREVDHRAKNALAVVQAALRLTKAPDLPQFVRTIEGRVSALARAQTLLAGDRWAGSDLHSLLRGEMAAFLDTGEGSQVELTGPPVVLPADATQPLAMAMHELATNAVKHGALSVPTGCVRVSWGLEGGPPGTLRLRWAEAGGPAVPGPPDRRGFGSRVLEGTVRKQLSGTLSLAWEPTGLVCDIEVPLARKAASAEAMP